MARDCLSLDQISSRCTNLHLQSNNLRSLPEGFFRGLNNLEQLHLQSNNLRSLPEGIFRGLNNLEWLSLYNNNLSSLPEGIFRGLNNLETLLLYNNNLSSLPEGIFRGLNNLEWLSLSNNNLSSLPEGIFRGLNNLETLLLYNNNLSCLPELPSSLRELYVDNIAGNDINNHSLPSCSGEENTPPEVIRQHGDVTFPRSGMDQTDRNTWGFTDDLSSNFRDPDGDDLTYTTTSSNPGLVRAVVNGSSLTYNAVVGGRTGTATVTVTASDGEASVSMSFIVTVASARPESSRPGNQPEETQPEAETQPESQPEAEPQPEEVEEQSFLDEWGDTLDAAQGEAEEEAAERAAKKAIASELGEEILGKVLKKGLLKAIPVVGFVDDLISIGEFGSMVIDTERSRARTRQIEQQNRQLEQQLQQKQQSQPGGDQSNSGFKHLLNDLATVLYLHQDALQHGHFSLAQAFSGRQFTYPFSLSQGEPQEANATGGWRFNGIFTGGLDFSQFRDGSGDAEVDGSSTTYRLGLDVLPNPETPLVTGLQLAYASAAVDFDDTELNTEGDYALRLFTVFPTVAWNVTEHLTIQASVGYGRGETETTINTVADDRFSFVEGSTTSNSGEFFSVAGGASIRVWQSAASALTLQVGGATSSFLDNDSQQGRLATQFSHDFALETGRLKSAANLALLVSDSDASTTELSGSLNWLPSQGRLSGVTSARVLLFGEDRSEWGIGGGLTLLPGQQGEGLSMALQPSFGQSSASLTGLGSGAVWDRYNDLTDLAMDTEPPTAHFHAQVAYGFRNGNGLLTPYTQLTMSDHSTVYGAGLRYALDTNLDLDLSASHRQRSSGTNDNRLFLQLRSDL